VPCKIGIGIFFTWHSSEHFFYLDVKWSLRRTQKTLILPDISGALFVSQRDHGIDARGSSSGNISRKHGDQEEEKRHADE
jgi:hypothetical protein